MRIEDIRTLTGSNIYHDGSVLVMTLNLGELAGKETHEVTGFMDQLMTLLPGIKQHHCANAEADAAVGQTPMMIGFGDITARVALSLATLAAIPVHYASVRHAEGPAGCHIVVEFTEEEVMRFLLQTAVEFVDTLCRGETPPLRERLDQARDLANRRAPHERATLSAADGV
jgi:cyanophycin synthetase